MQSLDIDQLRTFVAVVERESFAAAAAEVLRTQSAVTQQMRRLESVLGKRLFQRVGRGKQLTQDGVRLLDYARRLLALHDETCAAMASTAVSGELRLGAPHDITDSILPNLLAHFSRSFPGLRIAIHVGRSPHLLQALRQGDIDMTVAGLDAPELRQITLRTSPVVWMCAARYRHDPAQPLPLIVAAESSQFRRIAVEHLDRAGIPWRITYTSPTVVGVRAAVRAGLGVTARSVEMLGSDLRVMGEAEALPRLPDVNFRLYLSPVSANSVAQRVFDSLGDLSL
ncbi:LysR substrate-binding domain-containing protein [Bordetella sp. BOR01]|uniref:LysR substrate-binding domain-containing protein n=1 Tax=Bordetella sp. BOR01 TaxID=2854779 RepID=UPI001C457030|nr:LysR substrate-binding domain-containing protein [Bordetella sp. BOR01]MBV7483465.1 LysR family transcriptional regulator [Bordetella sp. BOR01]